MIRNAARSVMRQAQGDLALCLRAADNADARSGWDIPGYAEAMRTALEAEAKRYQRTVEDLRDGDVFTIDGEAYHVFAAVADGAILAYSPGSRVGWDGAATYRIELAGDATVRVVGHTSRGTKWMG